MLTLSFVRSVVWSRWRHTDGVAGDAFSQRVDAYLRSWLSKGAPSLFTTMRPLYQSPAKAQAIQALLEGYLTNLRAKPSRFTAGRCCRRFGLQCA